MTFKWSMVVPEWIFLSEFLRFFPSFPTAEKDYLGLHFHFEWRVIPSVILVAEKKFIVTRASLAIPFSLARWFAHVVANCNFLEIYPALETRLTFGWHEQPCKHWAKVIWLNTASSKSIMGRWAGEPGKSFSLSLIFLKILPGLCPSVAYTGR